MAPARSSWFGLQTDRGAPGRSQEVLEALGLNVVVDFIHCWFGTKIAAYTKRISSRKSIDRGDISLLCFVLISNKELVFY